MRPVRRLALALLVALLIGGIVSPDHVRGQEQPLVVFVVDEQLQTAAPTAEGPDGLRALAEIFRTLGARTETVTLSAALPADARVVVLIRPLRPLPVDQLARLWEHLLRGNHLLAAIDPVGLPVAGPQRPTAANPDRANSGLVKLLAQNYGIGLHDTAVIAAWFAPGGLAAQSTTFLQASPEAFARHPVIEPLAAHDIPVMTWGARTLWSEPLGPGSAATPLLTQDYGYGETGRVFGDNAEPLTVNIAADVQGRLLLGALAENAQFGSRLVFLGDSEALLDGYGLAIDPITLLPAHIGNRIFAERVASWLLGRDEWPVLAPSLTWLSVDGSGADWATPPVLSDSEGDSLDPARDIRQVYAFQDDHYLYLRVETTAAPHAQSELRIEIENTFDAVPDVAVWITPRGIEARSPSGGIEDVSDGAAAFGEGVELRLPLRVTGFGALLGSVCFAHERASGEVEQFDCTTAPPAVVSSVTTRAPADLHLMPGPLAWFPAAPATPVLAAPAPDAPVAQSAVTGQVFAAVGRNAAADWVQVRNARGTGWLPAASVLLNTDPASLPIKQGA